MHPKRADSHAEAGFTLAEMMAGLFVAALLVTGLAQVTRRVSDIYVASQMRIGETRSLRLAQAAFAELERADPGSVRVLPKEVLAASGDHELRYQIRTDRQKPTLAWETPNGAGDTFRRSVTLAEPALFAQTGRTISLNAESDGTPLLSVTLMRGAAFDCQFDSVVKDCR